MDPSSTSSSRSGPAGGWQAPSVEEMEGLLPQYQFECVLGRGGMGAVYKATQISLDRPVAIKVLPLELLGDEEIGFAQRFKNEAQTMARMNHPAIVSVYHFGETDTGLLYIVMEFIDGTDVAQIVAAQKKMPPDHALAVIAHVCDALQYAHSRGIVHRDIKPANILINREGEVKVADFGLAKSVDGGAGLTQSNVAMGTPDFVAPEVLLGSGMDGRADLYAVGVMLFQLLTGRTPRGVWKMPSETLGTDPRFDQIIEKAMQPNPNDRYQSAAEIRQDLDTIVSRPMSRIPKAAPPSAPLQTSHSNPLPRKPGSSGPVPKARSSSNAWLPALAAGLVVLGAGWWLLRGGPAAERPAETPGKPAPVTASAPAPAETLPELPKLMLQPAAAPASKPAVPVADKTTLDGTLDLLAAVDPARDAVSGEWEKRGSGLVTHHRRTKLGHHYLRLPATAVPDAYDLRVEFTRMQGGAAISLSLLSNAGSAMCVLDSSTGNKSNPNERACYVREAVDAGRHLRPQRFFEPNRPALVLAKVRPGSLQVFIDEEEVLFVPGGLSGRMQMPSDTFPEGTRLPMLGLGVCLGETVFHRIELRPADSEPTVSAKPAAAAAAAVAATAPPDRPEVVVPEKLQDPFLSQLASGFQRRCQEDVLDAHAAAVAALDKSYVANGLARGRTQALHRGDPLAVQAFDAEIARVRAGEGVPATDADSPPPGLAKLRKTYRQALADHETAKAQRTLPLYQVYVEALKNYVADLTRKDQIALAHEVQAFHDEVVTEMEAVARLLSSQDDGPATQAAMATNTPPAPSDSEPGPAGTRSSQQAAHWIVQQGGSATLDDGGRSLDVGEGEDIPSGKFDITGIEMILMDDSRPKLTAEDFSILEELQGLRSVSLTQRPITADHLRFLAGNRHLKSLTLALTDQLTSDLWQHLAEATELESLNIRDSQVFTGEGIGILPGKDALKSAVFINTAFSDKAAAELLQFPNLEHLHLLNAPLSSAGFEALAGLKQLQHLDLEGTAVDDSAATTLAQMNRLQSLNLELTQLTGSGLAKLQTLKNLKDLRVIRGNEADISEADLATLRAALPGCTIR